jgi:glutathione S-transferase
MKLRYSPTSPFVRKVVALAIETGLDSGIERKKTTTADPDLVDDNPLGKVPALITDDGIKMYDSPVICEYLDSLHRGAKLYPPAPALWRTKRLEALADGLMDAAVLRIYEGRRPEHERSAGWVARQTVKMKRALDAIETEAADLRGAKANEPVTIGEIALGCALGFLDFRFPADNWREGRPRLAAWWKVFGERPSMVTSRPQDPAAAPTAAVADKR